MLGAESRAFMYAGQALTLPCVSYVPVCNVSLANFGGIEKGNIVDHFT